MYHDSHDLTVSMDSSRYDHKCLQCGITDEDLDGLQAACTGRLNWHKRIEMYGGDAEQQALYTALVASHTASMWSDSPVDGWKKARRNTNTVWVHPQLEEEGHRFLDTLNLPRHWKEGHAPAMTPTRVVPSKEMLKHIEATTNMKIRNSGMFGEHCPPLVGSDQLLDEIDTYLEHEEHQYLSLLERKENKDAGGD